MLKPIKTILNTAILTLISSQAAQAGAFSLYTEGSAAAIGNFAAGIAAEGADASIGWYNPAGLILIKEQQAVVGGVGVFPSVKLTGSSAYNSVLSGLPLPTYTQTFSGLQGGKEGFVPSLHYALPLGERAVFGLSVVAPFGLSTDYGLDSPVRYAATLTKLETINVSPELGGKLTDFLSIGAGLDLQYAKVKFNSIVGNPPSASYVYPGSSPTLFDSQSQNSGDSFGIGFHAGLMLLMNDNHSRIGLNYQSRMQHEFDGSSKLTGLLANPALNFIENADEISANASYSSNNLFTNEIDLPDIVTLSGYHEINERWSLLGSAVYFGWSSFKSITLNNVAVGARNPITNNVILTTTNTTITENYKNTWRFAIGANYHVNDQWMMRFGGGCDETPTVDSERDVRLPDVNRWALSVGAHYQMRPTLGFDAGYTYLFANGDSQINKTNVLGTSTNTINAIGKNKAQLVGLQVLWKMDQPSVGK